MGTKWKQGHSEEAREKMRQKKLGTKHSDETRRKISETLKSKWDLIRKLESKAA